VELAASQWRKRELETGGDGVEAPKAPRGGYVEGISPPHPTRGSGGAS